MLVLVGQVFFAFFNTGLLFGGIFGVLILLRPLLKRLLRPKQLVTLWFVGWYLCYLPNLYCNLSYLLSLLLPFQVGLPAMLLPRVEARSHYPLYLDLPSGENGSLMLPGGLTISLPTAHWNMELFLSVLGALWLATIVLLTFLCLRYDRNLRRLGRQGVPMGRETLEQMGVYQEDVLVLLCRDLPTSFVRRGGEKSLWIGKITHVVYLQAELPPQRRELILRHEMEHVRLHHPFFKTIAAASLLIYAWNPLFWLAYRLTSRDMELACDEAVMEHLDRPQQRDYARSLVELGSGKHLWGGVATFGECDTVLRVKRLTSWQPTPQWQKKFSSMLTLLLILLFYFGGAGTSL